MPKYLKHDSEKGFIDDYVEIQALKFSNIQHVVQNNMLGDFDELGFYCVHPDIVKELIEMPKYIVEVMDNLEVCFGCLKLDKQISFLIAYEGEKATLSLLEKVNFEANNKLGAGSWSNVNEYVLDSVETSGEIDRQALYLKWNVQTFAGDVVDIFNCEDSVLAKYFNIVNRFKQNLAEKTTLLQAEEQVEENEAEYFLDLMEILKDYPELNKLVQDDIKQTLKTKKDFVKFDKPNFAKTLNEVAEKAIEANIKVLPQNQLDSFKTEKRNITLKKNIKNYDVVQFSTDKINNENERIENLEDSNIVEDSKTQTITKIKTKDVKFKSLKDVADEFAQTEKRVNDNKKDSALSTLTKGNKDKKESDTGLSNKYREILAVLSALGVATKDIVSAPVLNEIASKESKTPDTSATTESKQEKDQAKGGTSTAPSNKDSTKSPKVTNSKVTKSGPPKRTKKETKTDKTNTTGTTTKTGGTTTNTEETSGTQVKTEKKPNTLIGSAISGRRAGPLVNEENKEREHQNKEREYQTETVMEAKLIDQINRRRSNGFSDEKSSEANNDVDKVNTINGAFEQTNLKTDSVKVGSVKVITKVNVTETDDIFRL